jgi:hypothetical protein
MTQTIYAWPSVQLPPGVAAAAATRAEKTKADASARQGGC